MRDRAKVTAMRDANWTPASTYWRLRAEAAEEACEMAVCQAFSAGYEAGQRDANDPQYKADAPNGQTRLP